MVLVPTGVITGAHLSVQSLSSVVPKQLANDTAVVPAVVTIDGKSLLITVDCKKAVCTYELASSPDSLPCASTYCA